MPEKMCVYGITCETPCRNSENNRNLTGFLPTVDLTIHSKGCSYIGGYPYAQHYAHGRFAFYLLKDEIDMENGHGHVELYRNYPDYLLQLLKFISFNPETALRRLLAPPQRPKHSKVHAVIIPKSKDRGIVFGELTALGPLTSRMYRGQGIWFLNEEQFERLNDLGVKWRTAR